MKNRWAGKAQLEARGLNRKLGVAQHITGGVATRVVDQIAKGRAFLLQASAQRTHAHAELACGVGHADRVGAGAGAENHLHTFCNLILPLIARVLALTIPEMVALGAFPSDILSELPLLNDLKRLPESIRRNSFVA